MQYASNAVLAKARAMYAGHITFDAYQDLIGAKSLSELVARLRRNKRYSGVLEKATSDITADQLEELLRLSVLDQLAILGRYEISGGMDFYRFYIIKKDMEQILRCVRLLISGREQDYLEALPPFFNKLTTLNLIGLSSVHNMNDVLQILTGTPYRKILEPFAPIYAEQGAYLRIEAAFNDYLYALLTEMIRLDKADKKQVAEVLQVFLDSEFITGIYRLKKLRVEDDKIFDSYLAEAYTAFSKKQISELRNAPDEKEFIRVLENSVYGDAIRGLDYGNTEQVMENYVCKKLIKGLRFYTDPAAIMICYMYLAENEVMNLIRIVEGNRYGIAPEKILSVLTGIA